MIASEIQIVYKPLKMGYTRENAQDAYIAFLDNWNIDTIEYEETAKILLLNRANEVIGLHSLSTGGTAGTIIDVKKVFMLCLKTGAHGFILAHNHPSGNMKFSPADLNINKKLKEAGQIMEIQFLDSLIISPEKYLSAADECLL